MKRHDKQNIEFAVEILTHRVSNYNKNQYRSIAELITRQFNRINELEDAIRAAFSDGMNIDCSVCASGDQGVSCQKLCAIAENLEAKPNEPNPENRDNSDGR